MTTPPEEPAGVDGRSLGELILAADLTARAALWDPDPNLAWARTRTWGEVVEAAADLWAALPYRANGDSNMSRIVGLQSALHRTHQRTGWPGPGPGDPHLESVATSLARAAALARSRRHPNVPGSKPAQLDAGAARTRVMHVLYVSAHSVEVVLSRHAQELQTRLDARHRLDPGDSLQHARTNRERILAVERLAGSYLHARWPGALTGEHHEPAHHARLEQALARWDLQAHRALAGPPTAANLRWITRIQQDLAVAAGIIGAAAARRGLLDVNHQRDRLTPAVAGLEQAWGQLAHDLQPLISRQRRVDPELLLAGNEVHAALREITHHGGGVTTPEAMASRTDLGAAADSLHRSLTVAVDLAHVTRDALQDPALTISAHGAHQVATDVANPGTLRAWVNARDLHHNREIPLPQPVRDILVGHVQQLIDKAMTADSVAATVQTPTPPQPDPANVRGREHQDRATPAHHEAPPGFGCER